MSPPPGPALTDRHFQGIEFGLKGGSPSSSQQSSGSRRPDHGEIQKFRRRWHERDEPVRLSQEAHCMPKTHPPYSQEFRRPVVGAFQAMRGVVRKGWFSLPIVQADTRPQTASIG
jgi:hypothetical protein